MQSVKQEPIYLSDVESNLQPSRYLNLIQTCQNMGRETWNIWYLFASRPEMTQHLASFTQAVMREPSPLRPGLRELIAAYTSNVNECEFFPKAHVAVAAELLGSEDLVWTALRNLEASCLKEEEKALLRLVDKATRDLPSMTEVGGGLFAPSSGTTIPSTTQLRFAPCSTSTTAGLLLLALTPCQMKATGCAAKSWREKGTLPN